MNRKLTYAIALFIALILFVPAAARAQEQGYPFRLSNFHLEFTGGWVAISPDDLNRTVDYENSYLTHYYLNRYAYYDNLYGDAYSARNVFSGGQEFESLQSVTPLGAAIRYQASPTFSLSLGVQYIRGVKSSDVDLDVMIDDASAGASTAQYRNDGLTVSVKSWMPYLSANFGWDLFKFLRTEIFVMGGPIIGDLRAWDQRFESVVTEEGTVSSGSRTMEITGHSTSVAVEIGGQVRIKLLPFVEIFGQAGYAFRQLNQIQGLQSIQTLSELPTASESLYSLSGTWGVNWERPSSAWGSSSLPLLTTNFANGTRTTVANVDLSGFQVTAGLSIRL
ncbi:MAG: hypothetical protein PHI34_04525 [Acidobacteriota bacterium]|nr:hypothetical protein [Acidobacteriota bacterium]